MELKTTGIRALPLLAIVLSCQGAADRPATTGIPAVGIATPSAKQPEPVTPPLDASRKPSREPLIAQIEGVWAWTTTNLGCSENPHTLRFSEDNLVMYLTHEHPLPDPKTGVLEGEYVYDVESVEPDRILMRLRGEDRRTPSGALVEWELVVRSPDTYCWRRTDWQPEGCTIPNVRCQATAASR